VYEPGTAAQKAIVEQFGNEVLDPASGTIDRRKLGAIVFGSADKMKQLTDIVWPAIQQLARDIIQQYAKGSSSESGDGVDTRVVVLEAAVLLEAGWDSQVDEVWMTEVPLDVAKQRLMLRNNLSEEDALKRIQAQMSNEARAQKAVVRISTDDDRARVAQRVLEVFREREALWKARHQ
jgi:phosphopantetheine adenylyltransferase/dephospho-CoA kinase